MQSCALLGRQPIVRAPASAAIVGRLGTASLGAVGLSTLLFVFSNLFFNFLTVVTTSNVAGAYAVNDEQEVRITPDLVINVEFLLHIADGCNARPVVLHSVSHRRWCGAGV